MFFYFRFLPVLGSLLFLLGLGVLVGCDTTATMESTGDEEQQNCSINTDELREGSDRGSIVALSNPDVVTPRSERVSDLREDDRVIALLIGDTPLAVPRKLLNQHEIVNLDWANRSLAITYCPLTVSSLAFDRSAVDGAEFGVSGLLLHNNLVMFDKRGDESLWPQMSRRATCGANASISLDMVSVLDLRWGHWRSLHPDTKVLPVRVNEQGGASSFARGHSRAVVNRPMETVAKQSVPSGPVLGLPGRGQVGGGTAPPKANGGGIAFPFRNLSTEVGARVVQVSSRSVLFWSEEARAAMVYQTNRSFSVEDGAIVDDRTGSVWSIDGRAVDGVRKGDKLDPVADAHVAAGSAWADFHPETDVWMP